MGLAEEHATTSARIKCCFSPSFDKCCSEKKDQIHVHVFTMYFLFLSYHIVLVHGIDLHLACIVATYSLLSSRQTTLILQSGWQT